jgi:hypothetical protein
VTLQECGIRSGDQLFLLINCKPLCVLCICHTHTRARARAHLPHAPNPT